MVAATTSSGTCWSSVSSPGRSSDRRPGDGRPWATIALVLVAGALSDIGVLWAALWPWAVFVARWREDDAAPVTSATLTALALVALLVGEWALGLHRAYETMRWALAAISLVSVGALAAQARGWLGSNARVVALAIGTTALTAGIAYALGAMSLVRFFARDDGVVATIQEAAPAWDGLGWPLFLAWMGCTALGIIAIRRSDLAARSRWFLFLSAVVGLVLFVLQVKFSRLVIVPAGIGAVYWTERLLSGRVEQTTLDSIQRHAGVAIAALLLCFVLWDGAGRLNQSPLPVTDAYHELAEALAATGEPCAVIVDPGSGAFFNLRQEARQLPLMRVQWSRTILSGGARAGRRGRVQHGLTDVSAISTGARSRRALVHNQ